MRYLNLDEGDSNKHDKEINLLSDTNILNKLQNNSDEKRFFSYFHSFTIKSTVEKSTVDCSYCHC